MPPREAALIRGMVLGQDDQVDPATVEDFRRSGLAHILAVSGQNVMLLAALALPLLAAAGLRLRGRLIGVLALIALYVPLTGAGPSIQRAAVMGAAGIVAILTGRRRARWYSLLLAAAVTLGIDPRASGEVGWQLSFAAVAGILLWGPPIREAVLGRLGGDGWRRGAAEGLAMTVAASLATAPLMAHHFERVSLAALPANLLALPAMAPAMWLGMLVAAAGQLPGLPVEPLNWLNALLVAAIAQLAAWFAEPGWAVLDLRLHGPPAVAGAYAALLGGGWAVQWAARRRRGLGLGIGFRLGLRPGPGPARRAAVAASILAALAGLAALHRRAAAAPAAHPGELVVRVLDVGQGDAILLSPPGGAPVLVDAGPACGCMARRLRRLGVRRLAAIAVTHLQADHAGGAGELLGALPVGALVHADPAAALEARAVAAGARDVAVAAGDRLRSGGLRLDVLWPPRAPPAPGADPNLRAIVLLAEWQGFEMLLTADAEAEAVPIDPGPLDVLKVAHHGSRDAGLPGLLARSRPRLAAISVGRGNRYGHPTPETLAALAAAGVPVARTDRQGTVTIRVTARGWSVDGGG